MCIIFETAIFIVKQSVSDNVTIEDATIVQSEVFVYNLGTMFFIDKVMFADLLPKEEFFTTDQAIVDTTRASEWEDEKERGAGIVPDVLLQDAETDNKDLTTVQP